jgi:glycosyltransferase involved in cell wall biosynthesis
MPQVPLISVVIPCYNAEAWIEETIASAATQRHVQVEIVLVDDGSDDNSVKLATAAAEGVPLTTLAQARAGASRARAAGTRAARGAFIQYLDADDVLLTDTLSERLEALVQSGASVAYCDWVRLEQQPDGAFTNGNTVSRTLGARPDVELLTDAWWPPGALLYRRDLVERLTWREDLPIIQDARFLLDASLHGGVFVHVDAVGLKYRAHESSSLSRRDPRAFLEDCYANARDVQRGWERDGTLDDARRHALVRVYAYLARSFFAVDRDRFPELVEALFQLDPEFLPEGPRAFRALTRVVGYPRSEYVAAGWRQLRGTAKRFVQTQDVRR